MASSSRSSSRLQSKAPVSYEETPDEFEDEPTKRIKMSSKKLQHDKNLYPIEASIFFAKISYAYCFVE